MHDNVDDVIESALRCTGKNSRSTSARHRSNGDKRAKGKLRENPETDKPRSQSATALVDYWRDHGTNAQIDAGDERGRRLRCWLRGRPELRDGCSERCKLRVLRRRSAGNQRGCGILGELVIGHFSTAIAPGCEKGTASRKLLGKLFAKTLQRTPLQGFDCPLAFAGHAGNLLDGEVGNDAQHHDVALVGREAVENGAGG